jgi:site-specific DNA-methyltransferase (adenine-specific)
MSNKNYLNKITLGDCRDHIHKLDNESIHLFLSDIPYGINLDEWDVLHDNINSALLGQSPAQKGKAGFKRRGKPIKGWSKADRSIGTQYQSWVSTWANSLYPKMKKGSPLFIFGGRRTLHRAIVAFEEAGFLLRDTLVWKKKFAHHRAQKLSGILEKRELYEEAKKWEGWRLGNLAPIYEPIAWFLKPYDHTITDNVLENSVGAMNIKACKQFGKISSNVLEFGFAKKERINHEAQKPVSLLEYLIRLTTRENQIILDPFMGSGSTAISAMNLNRNFIGFEIVEDYHRKALKRLKEYSLIRLRNLSNWKFKKPSED